MNASFDQSRSLNRRYKNNRIMELRHAFLTVGNHALGISRNHCLNCAIDIGFVIPIPAFEFLTRNVPGHLRYRDESPRGIISGTRCDVLTETKSEIITPEAATSSVYQKNKTTTYYGDCNVGERMPRFRLQTCLIRTTCTLRFVFDSR